MIIEKFTKDNIQYIREIHDNGAINIYPDPEFQPVIPIPPLPNLPPLTTVEQKLDFIIDRLGLKRGFLP